MGRLRGCIWLTAGLVVAVVAGAIAFIILERAAALRSGEAAEEPRTEVVVAARAVEVRTQLTAQDLELKQIPISAVPETAVRDLAEAEGRITLTDLFPGEVIITRRLLDPNVVTGDGRYALMVVEDQVLMAYSGQDLMSQVGVLKPGDHVDVLASLDFPANRGTVSVPEEEGMGEGVDIFALVSNVGGEEEQSTFVLLEDVTVAAIVPGRATSSRSSTMELGSTERATGTPTPEAGAGSYPGSSEVTTAYRGVPVEETIPPRAILFTLAPQEALLLKYAWDAGGSIDIVLRAPGTERPFETDPVDMDYLIHRYRIPVQVGR